MSEVPIVGQSDSGAAGYHQLAGIFFLNIWLPYVQIFTNRAEEREDCYDSCGLALALAVYVFWFPSVILWGIPLVSMGLYSFIGERIGLKGSLLKFMILYTSRFGGLLWLIVSQAIGAYLFYYQMDFIFPFIHLISSFLFERAYTDAGAEALRYIDPTWTQDPNAIYPFTV